MAQSPFLRIDNFAIESSNDFRGHEERWHFGALATVYQLIHVVLKLIWKVVH